MTVARLYALALAVLFGFFAFFAHSMVRVTIFQLRLDITRRELLNYELASGILNSRFENLLSGGRDFDGEIRMSVLESSVLNSEPRPGALKLDPFEWSGLAAVNFVRFLNFKSALGLREDAERLLMLQYAFYMQRKKRFDSAIAAYDELERKGPRREEDRAFILLHGGYSHALAGHFGEAVSRLKRVRREYAGSHFAQSAGVLLDFLLNRGGEAMLVAEDLSLSPERRAAAYYRAGRFLKVIELLQPRLHRIPPRTRLIYARSLEESGQIARSAEHYKELVESGAPAGLRRNANRRLLLLGNFYAAGDRVKAYAEKQSVALGDAAALRQIKKRKVYYDSPRILKKLAAGEREDLPGELIETIRDNLEQSMPAEELTMLAGDSKAAAETASASKPESLVPETPGPETSIRNRLKRESAEESRPEPAPRKVSKPAAKPSAPKPPVPAAPVPAMRVLLKDGRTIPADSVEFANESLRLSTGGGEIQVDPGSVRTILGRDESAGISITLDEIPVKGVKLGYRNGNMLVRPAEKKGKTQKAIKSE